MLADYAEAARRQLSFTPPLRYCHHAALLFFDSAAAMLPIAAITPHFTPLIFIFAAFDYFDIFAMPLPLPLPADAIVFAILIFAAFRRRERRCH